MKILIYMSSGFDINGPSNHLFQALIEDLLQANHDVVLIEKNSKGPNDDVPSSIKKHKKFKYFTVSGKTVKKNRFITRYISSIIYAYKSIKYLKINKDVDLVFIQSCPTAPFQVKFAKKYVGKPVVYNIQDMFPGSSIASGVMKNSIMKIFFYWFQKKAYRRADHITVISDDMKSKLMLQDVEKDKITTIVNWFDDNSVSEIPWDDNIFVKKFNLDKNKFYVQYAGTMGYVFDYKAIIHAAKILKHIIDIEFVMIGNGSQKECFINQANENELTNIKFIPYQNQSEISHVYSACNLCVIPLKKGVIGNSVPSKAGIVMACNRTIINSVDEDSSYYSMFNLNDIGVSVPNDDYDRLVRSIMDLYNDRPRLNQLNKRAYKYALENFTRSNNTMKYIHLFKNIIERREI